MALRDNVTSNLLGAPGALVERVTGTDDDTFETWNYSRSAAPYPRNSSRVVRTFRPSERYGYTGTGTGKLDNELLDLLILNPPTRLGNNVAFEGAESGKYRRTMTMAFDVSISQAAGQYGLTLTLTSDGDIGEADIP